MMPTPMPPSSRDRWIASSAAGVAVPTKTSLNDSRYSSSQTATTGSRMSLRSDAFATSFSSQASRSAGGDRAGPSTKLPPLLEVIGVLMVGSFGVAQPSIRPAATSATSRLTRLR